MNFSIDANYAIIQSISITLSIAKYTSIISNLRNIFLYAKYADLIADFIRIDANYYINCFVFSITIVDIYIIDKGFNFYSLLTFIDSSI